MRFPSPFFLLQDHFQKNPGQHYEAKVPLRFRKSSDREAAVMPLYPMISLALFGSLLVGVVILLLLGLRRRRPTTHRTAAQERFLEEKTALAEGDDEQLPQSLPGSVTASDHDLISRDQWVLRMTRHVFNERHRGRHNVLVINDDLEYHFSPDDVVEEFSVTYRDARRTVPYRVVVFREGSLLNLGDGGDINWDWMGNFVRHNDSMLTFRPCVKDVRYQQDGWVAVST